MRIAVAGGTGLVGTMAVAIAADAGHRVEVLARSRGVDLLQDGPGLAARLTGVDAVIDVTNSTTVSARRSRAHFTTVTAHLLAAEALAGVRHHIALSVVGVDRAPYGYYAGKLAQERLVAAGRVPWTILRSTQFHEMARIAYETAQLGPLHLAVRMRTQPVAAREVAQRLVDIATAPPQNSTIELAGPREEALEQMVLDYARAIGSRGWIPIVSLPGSFGRAQRDGTLLPRGDVLLGEQTFPAWLADLTG